MTTASPLVTVLTPVHNAEQYLVECIVSVLGQSYQNCEYVIVNNCSTDRTLQIAERFAAQDYRIRIVNNDTFVGVVENHNLACRELSPESAFCKIVSADDWLYPECIARMVAVCEAHPSVGIVGCYQLSGAGSQWNVKWSGLPYATTVIDGFRICRETLLGGRYVFGCPTSVLYRADLIRNTPAFFPNPRPHADVSAFYEYLAGCDFGFVHQVLCYERVHEDSVGARSRRIGSEEACGLRDLLQYGPLYLSCDEFDARLRGVLDDYYRLLVEAAFHHGGSEFWAYHLETLQELGLSLWNRRLFRPLAGKLLDLMFNPLRTFEKLSRRLRV